MPSSFPAGVSTTDPETASRSRAQAGDGPEAARGSTRLALAADEAAYECARCAETKRTCPSCGQRRRYGWSLVNERGATLQSAARRTRLPPDRVLASVQEWSQRREP